MAVTMQLLIVAMALVSFCRADFKCLCNYHVELNVLDKSHQQTLGYMYEFDCKPVVEDQTSGDTWVALAYEHQLGFVQKDAQVQLQTCPGSPSQDDILFSTEEPALETTPQISMNDTNETPVTMMPTTISITEKMTTATEATPTSTPRPTTITTTQRPTTTPTTQRPTTTTITQRPTTTPTTQMPTTITTTQRATTTPTPIKTTYIPTVESTTTTTKAPATHASGHHVNVCPQLVQQFAIDDGNYLTTSNNTCYELVTRLSNWNEAEANCKQKGGNLVHIESKAKQTFIFDFIVKNIGTNVDHSAWIGLHDQNQESHYQWVSGEPLTYTDFHNHGFAGIFQNHGREDCIVMGADYNGEWDDRECDIGTYYHICQYPTVDSSTIHVTTPDPSVIQEGNIHLCSHSVQHDSTRYHGILGQYDHNCYELIPGQKSTWEHGESHCKTIGGHLAHISNAQEQDYIQRFMTEYYPQHAVWIGLNDKGTEGTFHWTSGGVAQYTNWIPGHLSNFVSHHEEDCVAFIPYKSGQWDDIPCGHRGFFGGDTGEMHPILCQYKTREPGTLVGK